MTGGATDEALLRAWQAGDAAAGNALFERYFDALYRFFVHKHVDGDVMDLLQKTLLASVESLDRFEGHSSVRTYLYAIARNKLRDYWRERARNDGIDFGVSSLLDLGPSPSSLLRANEEQRLLFEALRRLPLDQQIAVELHYWDGLSGPQLAEVFGVPEGTVRGRLHRARARLRELVDALASDPSKVPETDASFEAWVARAAPT
ncbi:MAG: sigma-70 family RNA polymerase sigma factor [Sandaracinaceae bacterium]